MKKGTTVRRTWLWVSLILTSLLGLLLTGAAQDSVWTRKTDMPYPTYHMGTTVIDGKFYLMTGWLGGGASRYFHVYDTQTDTWSRKADIPSSVLPIPISGATACAVDGKIYLMGGGGGVPHVAGSIATLKVYNLASGTWTLKADIPTPRSAIAAEAVDGKIYAFGGVDKLNEWWGAVVKGGPFLNVVEEYDPVTDTWAKKADMSIARSSMASAVVDGKIYVIGGAANTDGMALNTVEEYDPVTDTWAKKADMPTARWEPSAVVAGGKIYVIGGNVRPPYQNTAKVAIVEIYDPVTDTWANGVPMNFPRQKVSAGLVNGVIYTIGGAFNGWQSPLVESYDTGSGIRIKAISPWHTGFPNPQVGTIDGGEHITISGNRFPPDSIVTIDGNPLTQMQVTDTLITGLTPPGHAGEQAVKITASSLDFPVLAGKFIYLSPTDIALTGISPTQGQLKGGKISKITGDGFLPGATVSIGNVEVTNVVVTPTIITFTIPSGTAGKVDVSVKNPDGKSKILSRAYTYIGPPTIESIFSRQQRSVDQTFISLLGSHNSLLGSYNMNSTPLTITIEGTGFIRTPTVRFGTVTARVEFISSEELEVRLPRVFGVGPLDIAVANPDGQRDILPRGVTALAPPKIKSIKPTSGGVEGFTEITIVGEPTVELEFSGADGLVRSESFPSRFVEGVIVRIGEVEADKVTVQSDHVIIAIAPANNPGPKAVTVINPDSSEDTFDNAFTYNPIPTITLIKPNNGKLDGGTKIEIIGGGFLPGASVQLGTGSSFTDATLVKVISDGLIVAETPNILGHTGVIDIRVINPDRQKILRKDAFTYNMQPTINKISPRYGSTSGGTIIIIEGAGFLLGAKVSIGKRPATTEYKSNFQIEAVTPSNPSGTFDVKLVNPDGQETLAPAAFLSVSETVYNYPNPFRASQGTTFRYVANEEVKEIKVQIFNLNGEPIGLLRQNGGGEIKWYNPDLNFGLYVYQMEVKLVTGQTRTFQKLLQVE